MQNKELPIFDLNGALSTDHFDGDISAVVFFHEKCYASVLENKPGFKKALNNGDKDTAHDLAETVAEWAAYARTPGIIQASDVFFDALRAGSGDGAF